MSCDNLSFDNRETCATLVPSSCIPYTGYVSPNIAEDIPQCRPNINDILKALQELIDKIKDSLGDNTTLDKDCLDFDAAIVKQVELNQLFIDELCAIKAQIGSVDAPIDPNLILLIVNLLCLEDPACDPKTSYTLQEIIVKLITAYCDLLARVTNIETILNI